MRKFLVALSMIVSLSLVAGQAMAAQMGIYVAPKFMYGFTIMDGKGKVSGGDNLGTNLSVSNSYSTDTDHAFGGALAIGYNFDKQFKLPIRAELEYAAFSRVEAKGSQRRNHNVTESESYGTKQQFDIQTLFLNAYFDIKTGTPITPYVGAGAGAAFIDSKARLSYDYTNTASPADNNSESLGLGSKSTMNFAWNVGAGAAWDITDSIALDLGYRFVGLGEAKAKTHNIVSNGTEWTRVSAKTDNLYMHQVMLGVRFSF